MEYRWVGKMYVVRFGVPCVLLHRWLGIRWIIVRGGALVVIVLECMGGMRMRLMRIVVWKERVLVKVPFWLFDESTEYLNNFTDRL
jgi:hypothetical protein